MPVRFGWPLFLPTGPAPARLAIRHAPRGGARVLGRTFAGGQFLPELGDPSQATLFSEADDTPPPRVGIDARTPPRDEPRRPLPSGPKLTSGLLPFGGGGKLTSGLDSKPDSGYTPPETPQEEPAMTDAEPVFDFKDLLGRRTATYREMDGKALTDRRGQIERDIEQMKQNASSPTLAASNIKAARQEHALIELVLAERRGRKEEARTHRRRFENLIGGK